MRGAGNRQDWRNVKGTIQGIYGLYKNAHLSGRHYVTRPFRLQYAQIYSHKEKSNKAVHAVLMLLLAEF